MIPEFGFGEYDPRASLCEWFTTRVGATLLDMERRKLKSVLPDLFGYHIVQVGGVGADDLLEASRISHRIVLDLEVVSPTPRRPVCNAGALPLTSQSVDVVLIPHVLEFERDPHAVLREAERVLIGEGHLLLFGFNPWSLWGLCRAACAWRDEPPWNGRFLSVDRVKDWLHLLGFDIIEARHFYFRPPVQAEWIQQRCGFIEAMGSWLWPYFGGVYFLVGRKRLVTLTPIALQARRKKRVANGVVGQPTCGTRHG